MAMTIQHNMHSANTQRQYGMAARKMSSNAEKLSSGYRINRSADDAAGLAISEKMRRQIRGLARGIQNTEEGISLCQVADGALNEVHDIVHRLNALSVQAANGTNERSDREMLQDEVNHLLTEINRISDTTTFNGQNLFGGAGAGEFIGHDAGKGITSANEAVAKAIIEAGNADRYMNSKGADADVVKAIVEALAEAKAKPKPVLSGVADYAVEGYEAEKYAARANSGAALANSGAKADNGISALADDGGIEAYALGGLRARAAGDIYGDFEVSGGTKGIDFDFNNATQELTVFAGKTVTIKNAVTAANLKKLIANNGSKITLDGDFKLSGTDSWELKDGAKLTLASNSSLTLSNNAVWDMKSGATLTLLDKSVLTLSNRAVLYVASDNEGFTDKNSTGILLENGAQMSIIGNAALGLQTDGYLYLRDSAILELQGTNKKIYNSDIFNGWGIIYARDSSSYDVRKLNTNMMQFYYRSNPTHPDPFPEVKPPVSKPISAYAGGGQRFMKKWWIQSGNDAHDGMYVDIDVMNVKTLGLLGLNVTTQANADRAINTIDGALAYVSRMRSRIGAQQNRLEHIVLNENNIVENTTAAESRIRDVDIAEGMAAFSIANILVRAGETMLAQANTSNEGVMALLR